MPELSQKERVMEITEKLEKGIKDLFESDKYKAYLNCMSKFHNYSLNNTMLIAAQMPEATLVAGYNSWTKDHERYIKKGEKGIQIIAPYKFNVTEQIETESGPKEQEKEIKGFKVSYVFDVSQTEGKELPLIESKELTGSADGYQKLFMALMGYLCQFDRKRKYWTIKQKDWQRPIRIARLGDDYTNEAIRRRIEDKALFLQVLALSGALGCAAENIID